MAQKLDPDRSVWAELRRLIPPLYVPIAMMTLGVGIILPIVPLYLEDTGVLSVLHDGMCAMAKVRPQDPRQFIADYLLDHAPVPDYVKAMDSFDEKKVGAQMDALHEGAREVLANKVE